ncbi:MAG: hypothetical protein Kow0063_42250 [Anaerolineae bacterium]
MKRLRDSVPHSGEIAVCDVACLEVLEDLLVVCAQLREELAELNALLAQHRGNHVEEEREPYPHLRAFLDQVSRQHNLSENSGPITVPVPLE